MNATVIGAGSWGTALAQVLSDNIDKTSLWVRKTEMAEEIRKNRENKKYLPGVALSQEIHISTDLEQVLCDADLVIMAVSSHAMRTMAKRIGGLLNGNAVVVSASKGLELKSYLRMSQVLQEELPDRFEDRIAILSGPSHAEEVVMGLPTAIVVATENGHIAAKVQSAFMNDYFRVYTNPDIVGVELGGALKNVIALCSGIADGLGLGDNSKAALITRGIAEMARLGVELGAKKSTFSGLTGIGDLIVTCASMLSRNRRAGIEIGKGRALKDVLNSIDMVVEGVNASKAAFLLSLRHKVEMPITKEAHAILFEDKGPKEALFSLMTREGKLELEELAFAGDPD